MIEYWVMVIAGVVAVAATVAGAYLYAKCLEIRFVLNRQKLKIYNDFLCAVTRITIAHGDTYALSQAKKNLAFVLNRVNLVAGPEVLGHVNEFLDLLNEAREGDVDVLKEKNILNAIVQAARNELDPESARALQEAQARYRFYNPPRT